MKRILNLSELVSQSFAQPIFIFKHSATCPISAMAKQEVQAFARNHPEYPIYQIIVQVERRLSKEVARIFAIKHETPQLLLVDNGRLIEALNHFQISRPRLEEIIRALDR